MLIPQRLRHSYTHWTPRYIYNRLGVMWFMSRNPHEAWLTKTALEILNTWLSKEDVGLEWGSGRSTLWFAKRVKHLTSVENDELWFKRVGKRIEESNVDNVKYLYRPDVDSGMHSDYVRVVDDISPSSLDFVLVDGQDRDHCSLAALPLIKPGGIFIFDNANWYLPHKTYSPRSRTESEGPAPGWEEVTGCLKNWRCIWTSNGVWDTAFWVKPVS